MGLRVCVIRCWFVLFYVGLLGVKCVIAATIDSIQIVKDDQYENLSVGEKIQVLERLVEKEPSRVDAVLKLAHAYLDMNELDAAKRYFRRAMILAPNTAAPYYGMGLLFMALPTERYRAISYFRKALGKDRSFVAARYQIAKARFLMNELDTKIELERVLAMDPNYAEAHLLMADWLMSIDEYGQAVVWLTQYLDMRPEDDDARRKLGLAYLYVKDYEKIQNTLLSYIQQNPQAVDLMPIVAQACMKRSQFDAAMTFFETYLNTLPSVKKDLYTDINLVGSDDELMSYGETPKEERQAFWDRFWQVRDPDLSTVVNERLLEHYRRVWYACTAFSEGQEPFDRRGEVYIRFGEPDHRTRSRAMNLSQDLAVQRVREQLAVNLYGTSAIGETFRGPVFPVQNFALRRDVLKFEGDQGPSLAGSAGIVVEEGDAPSEFVQEEERSEEERRNAPDEGPENRVANSGGQSTRERRSRGEMAGQSTWFMNTGEKDPFAHMGNFRPVTSGGEDHSSVPWEVWVYIRINGGIEIVFTDPFGTGDYDFAPVPSGPEVAVDQLARLQKFSPRETFESATQVVSDFYEMDVSPFHFYYAVADFRSDSGLSEVEIYLGIPCRLPNENWDTSLRGLYMTRYATLIPSWADSVYKAGGDLVYKLSEEQTSSATIIPDVVCVKVPSGMYALEVKVQHRQTGQVGLYRQDLKVSRYDSTHLQLSGLVMAWHIRDMFQPKHDDEQVEHQNVFVRNDLEIIPMPSRTYQRGQNAYVYYEIYNLERDAFGQTHYEVEYTIGEKSNGSILARLIETFQRSGQEEVGVGYVRRGGGDWEGVYTELDLSRAESGRHTLKVEVTDLNSGNTISRETVFVVAQ